MNVSFLLFMCTVPTISTYYLLIPVVRPYTSGGYFTDPANAPFALATNMKTSEGPLRLGGGAMEKHSFWNKREFRLPPPSQNIDPYQGRLRQY